MSTFPSPCGTIGTAESGKILPDFEHIRRTPVKRSLYVLFLLTLIAPAARADDKPKVEFRDGDRIALVGNEFFERDQERGYIETELTSRFPDKNLTFRNLGYSGDTVRADARNLCSGWAVFGPADQGFDRLKDLIEHIKPTLVFVAYGMNESFDGPAGLDSFTQGLSRMLDMVSAGGARVVLISPIRHEDLGRPLPDPAAHNQNIRLYCDALEKVAQQRNCPFIDLYEALGDSSQEKPGTFLTFDGIHLTPFGYWKCAAVLERAMGYPPRRWDVNIDTRAGKAEAIGTKIDEIKTGEKGITFNGTDDFLPLAQPPEDAPKSAAAEAHHRVLKFTGLSPGQYVLKSGDQTIASGSADDWAKGIALHSGPAQDQEEELRKLVVAKEFDFFNFWRPDNDTYIFGYRKHEQGRNAVEIPMFEPLVEAKEAQIAKLRVPVTQAYVLSRE